jgi:endothelin-converting enzyme/putative endopeptidase
MVDDLTKAFGSRIDALDWMTAETKAKAKEKVKTLYVGVGYPDKWVDYTALQIVKGDALGNRQRAEQFEYRRQLAKLAQPVDRTEWWMTPQTVNAVNLPLQNALNFPAAILQPPFFDPARDAAANFGAMGATIGHEISHSFDDQGALFDSTGRLDNWWTPSDLKQFQRAGEALAKQFDGYKPFPDLALNGQQTLSENIADLGGVKIAYLAFQKTLTNQPQTDKTAFVTTSQLFSPEQRFFIAYAQIWRVVARPEVIRILTVTDTHAFPRFRVIGPLANIGEFSKAFAWPEWQP